jgi:hypothetical protein
VNKVLLRVRPLLCAALAFVLLASAVSAQSSGPDAARLRAIEAQVSRIRGLAPLAEPPLQLLDHTTLSAYLTDEFNKNYLPNERESDQKELVTLGLIQPTDNLVQIELNLLTEQVIGVYDPDAKSLFVVSDENAFGPAARITYAHEFNHALQDQHYDLSTLAPHHGITNDRSLAVHALIEGDAVLLQTLWAETNLTESDLRQLASGSAGADNGLAQAPLIVRSELLFPYTDGFNFVRDAYRTAGNNYSAVTALFSNPPESTAQVLHPDEYRTHVHPVDVRLADLSEVLGPQWRNIGGGVLGELDTRVLLEQWGATRRDAARIAAGWSGDRWQLVESTDGRMGMALKSAWESPDAAGAFFSAYTAGLRTRFDDASVDASTTTREALTDAAYATDVTLQDGQVLAVLASDRETAGGIVAAVLTSSSAL